MTVTIAKLRPRIEDASIEKTPDGLFLTALVREPGPSGQDSESMANRSFEISKQAIKSIVDSLGGEETIAANARSRAAYDAGRRNLGKFLRDALEDIQGKSWTEALMRRLTEYAGTHPEPAPNIEAAIILAGKET